MSPSVRKVNLTEMFGRFKDQWSPKIVGEVNDSLVKLTKLKGEFVIIPHGVEHLPVADEETHVLLFEPNSTLNTGNVRNERTVAKLDHL